MTVPPEDDRSPSRNKPGKPPAEPGQVSSTDETVASDPAATVDLGRSGENELPSTRQTLDRLSSHATQGRRYDLELEIGRGGMGAILKVRDRDLRRTLAMKVLLQDEGTSQPSRSPGDELSLGRFIEEAQVTGQLSHPGVVPVHELGVDSNGRVYFTMRLVDGRDLSKIWELVANNEDGWSLSRAIGVMLKVCEAMAYAHSKGVIHRDLKPANIMVGRFGEVYVMDWGLAKVLGGEDKNDVRLRPRSTNSPSAVRTDRHAEPADSPLLTMDGNVVGTPAYMSPEQAHGDLAAMGPHSDVYSLGAMLYHLLAGHGPYVPRGKKITAWEILERVKQSAPDSLEVLAKDAPEELVAICQKAMAREAEERYSDTQEMADDLQAFLEGRVVKAHRTGLVIELKKLVSRNKGLTGAIGLALIAIVVGFVVSTFYAIEAGEQAIEAQENEARARRENQNFRQLADLKTLRDLLQSWTQLGVRTDQDVARVEGWVLRAQDFSTRRAAHARALAETRERGIRAGKTGEFASTTESSESEWSFTDPTSAFLHTALEELEGDGQRLVEVVLQRARGLLSGAEESRNSALWAEVMADVPEVKSPDLGLVPLGKNAQGLWEFWHHESGARPRALEDLTSIADWPVRQWADRKRRLKENEIRAAVSRWQVEDTTGLIFVLVPRGLVTPLLEEVAEASYVSKYEMTRAQWDRLTDTVSDPSGERTTPVERVGWLDCAEKLSLWGLEIPSRKV